MQQIWIASLPDYLPHCPKGLLPEIQTSVGCTMAHPVTENWDADSCLGFSICFTPHIHFLFDSVFLVFLMSAHVFPSLLLSWTTGSNHFAGQNQLDINSTTLLQIFIAFHFHHLNSQPNGPSLSCLLLLSLSLWMDWKVGDETNRKASMWKLFMVHVVTPG